MLRCQECPKTEVDPTFQFASGRPALGPAYWNDTGVFCGAACSTQHTLRRIADGTFDPKPPMAPPGMARI